MSIMTMCRGFYVNIARGANQQDTSGGPTRDPFTPIATMVPCAIQPASEDLMMWYGQRGIKVSDHAYFSQDQGLRAGWRLQTATGAQRTFIVRGYTPGGMAGKNRIWRADLEERLS